MAQELMQSQQPIRPILNFDAIVGLIDSWLDDIEKSATTKTTYKRGVEKLIEWLEANPRTIDAAAIKAWRDALRADYAPVTVNTWLSAVRSFFGWLLEQKQTPYDPTAQVKSVPTKSSRVHKRDELTNNEVRRLFELIDGSQPEGLRLGAMIALMAYCGLRQVEVQRANVEHIQDKGGRKVLWVQGKGRQSADEFVVLPDSAENALSNWLSVHPTKPLLPTTPLFCGIGNRSRGQRLTTTHIRREVKALFKLAGVTAPTKTTHSLRHSAISNAIRNGGNLMQVQAMARHTDPKTTMIYVHEIARTDAPAEDLIDY